MIIDSNITIGYTLTSIEKQTFKDYEVIIVDDGSTEWNSRSTLLQLFHQYSKQFNITILFEQNNLGLSNSRNSGISIAQGTWILPLDSDDAIHPTFLEKSFKYLNNTSSSNNDNEIIISDLIGFVENSNNVINNNNNSSSGSNIEIIRHWSIPNWNRESLRETNLLHCSAIYKKSLWKSINGYNSALWFGWEDWDFWLRADRSIKSKSRKEINTSNNNNTNDNINAIIIDDDDDNNNSGLKPIIIREDLFMYREKPGMHSFCSENSLLCHAMFQTLHPNEYSYHQILVSHKTIGLSASKIYLPLIRKIEQFPDIPILHLWLGLCHEYYHRDIIKAKSEYIISQKLDDNQGNKLEWQSGLLKVLVDRGTENFDESKHSPLKKNVVIESDEYRKIPFSLGDRGIGEGVKSQVDTYCRNETKYMKEGELCDEKIHLVDYECTFSTYCPDDYQNKSRVCTKYLTFDEYCNPDSPSYQQCFPETMTCDKTTRKCKLKGYLGAGEQCKDSSECNGGMQCNEGKCKLSVIQQCTKDTGCEFGYYCDISRVSSIENKCKPYKQLGQACSDHDECPYDCTCEGFPSRTCRKSFSLISGEKCSTSNNMLRRPDPRGGCDIGQNLWCDTEVYICRDANLLYQLPPNNCSRKGCAANEYLSFPATCACQESFSYNKGECVPNVNMNQKCKDFVFKVAKCAVDNKCPTIYNPSYKSCLFQSCGHLICGDNPCLSSYYKDNLFLGSYLAYKCTNPYTGESMSAGSTISPLAPITLILSILLYFTFNLIF
eukprot:gene9210-11286_t